MARTNQFDYGYMEDGGPLQIACFLVGTDTSSGAIHATMVLDSKKMDMPYVVAATAKWVRGQGYSQHTENQRHELQPLISDPSTYVKKRAQRSDDSILLRHTDDVVGTGPEEHLMSDFEHMNVRMRPDCDLQADLCFRSSQEEWQPSVCTLCLWQPGL